MDFSVNCVACGWAVQDRQFFPHIMYVDFPIEVFHRDISLRRCGLINIGLL